MMHLEQLLQDKGLLEHNDVYEITYEGNGFSTNQFYTARHWYARHKIKRDYGEAFSELIEKSGMKPIERYSLFLLYNSNHDPSNATGMIKVFEDVLCGSPERVKGQGKIYTRPRYIKDDSKKYCLGISCIPVEDIEKNHFKFLIYSYDEENFN